MSDTHFIMEDIEASLLTGRKHLISIFAEASGQKGEGRETIATCPFCKKKEHFYISNIKPVYNCQRCNEAGNFWTYLEKIRSMSRAEALKYMAAEAGIELPKQNFTQVQREAYEARQRRGSLLEEAHTFFTEQLFQPEGEPVLQYLIQNRGYTQELIQTMGLGAYLGQDALKEHLSALGFSEDEQQQAGLYTRFADTGEALGSTHQLAFLWRERSGTAKGLGFRMLLSDEEAEQQGYKRKYLYSKGMKKASSLIGLDQARGSKRVVIVEGLIDALLLNALGIPAGGAGGSSLSQDQIKHLSLNEVEEVLLALDNDEAGQKGTDRAIQSLLKVAPFARVYTVPLQGFKDPDELLRIEGLKELKLRLEMAEGWPAWKVEHIYAQADLFSEASVESAFHEALQFYLSIEARGDARKFKEALLSKADLPEEEFTEQLRKYQQRQAEHKKEQAAQGLIQQLQQLNKQGDIIGLEEALASGLLKLKAASGFQVPEPYTTSQWEQDIYALGGGLGTGFPAFNKAYVRVPEGAITIISGRPGHGKTSLMLNMLLNMVKLYPEKRFYFFTYEEAREWLMLKLLMIMAGRELHKEDNQRAYLNYMKEKKGSDERIERAYEQLTEYTESGRLYVIDQSINKLSAEALVSLMSSYNEQGNTGAHFVDYIQKIPVEQSHKTGARYLEIKRASELLLDQAVRSGTAVILGAQLNREGRGKPKLSNLREGGDIEQDANLIIGLLNPTMDEQEEEGTALVSQSEVKLEAHINKNRGAQAGRKLELDFKRSTLQIK